MYREEPQAVQLTMHTTEVLYDDAKAEEIREVTECDALCYEKSGKLYLKYENVEEEQQTTTILVITPEELIIRRKGAINSRMQFRRNLTYSFLYQTPIGAVPLTVVTKEFLVDIQKEAIKIHLSYDLASQDQVVSYRQIQLEARTS
ncbi:MAG: DUF1934 domain-containing protein [Lachnospiraceae bacterium]|nr:DUF1934 domain-containing protein [Lachnospiraceae bacterium]